MQRLEKQGNKWNDTIKLCFWEVDCEGVRYIELAEDEIRFGGFFAITVIKLPIL
jgi:hypothetical protein